MVSAPSPISPIERILKATGFSRAGTDGIDANGKTIAAIGFNKGPGEEVLRSLLKKVAKYNKLKQEAKIKIPKSLIADISTDLHDLKMISKKDQKLKANLGFELYDNDQGILFIKYKKNSGEIQSKISLSKTGKSLTVDSGLAPVMHLLHAGESKTELEISGGRFAALPKNNRFSYSLVKEPLPEYLKKVFERSLENLERNLDFYQTVKTGDPSSIHLTQLAKNIVGDFKTLLKLRKDFELPKNHSLNFKIKDRKHGYEFFQKSTETKVRHRIFLSKNDSVLAVHGDKYKTSSGFHLLGNKKLY